MAIVKTQTTWLPMALNTIATLFTDTTGPAVCKFSLDTLWLPAGTVANLSIQTLSSSSAVQYEETENVTLSNAVTLYQQTTGGMTAGSAVLTLVTAFATALIVGQEVVVIGAGVSGANLYAVVTGVTSTTSYTLSVAAGTTVSAVNVYAGLPNNGIGYEPVWESETYMNPYGIQVQAQLVAGSVFPPLALTATEIAVS